MDTQQLTTIDLTAQVIGEGCTTILIKCCEPLSVRDVGLWFFLPKSCSFSSGSVSSLMLAEAMQCAVCRQCFPSIFEVTGISWAIKFNPMCPSKLRRKNPEHTLPFQYKIIMHSKSAPSISWIFNFSWIHVDDIREQLQRRKSASVIEKKNAGYNLHGNLLFCFADSQTNVGGSIAESFPCGIIWSRWAILISLWQTRT